MKNREYIQRRIPADLSQVEIREQWQITFWTLKLSTTQDRLSQALREVGPDLENVRAWLETTPTSRPKR